MSRATLWKLFSPRRVFSRSSFQMIILLSLWKWGWGEADLDEPFCRAPFPLLPGRVLHCPPPPCGLLALSSDCHRGQV